MDYAAHQLVPTLCRELEVTRAERDVLSEFDDYFRSACGFKRDGRSSKECLDEFLNNINLEGPIIPFDHHMSVLKERDAALSRVAELEAERERDHAEINLKADVIERMINQSAADYERLETLEELVRGFANQIDFCYSTATERFIWAGLGYYARAATNEDDLSVKGN